MPVARGFFESIFDAILPGLTLDIASDVAIGGGIRRA